MSTWARRFAFWEAADSPARCGATTLSRTSFKVRFFFGPKLRLNVCATKTCFLGVTRNGSLPAGWALQRFQGNQGSCVNDSCVYPGCFHAGARFSKRWGHWLTRISAGDSGRPPRSSCQHLGMFALVTSGGPLHSRIMDMPVLDSRQRDDKSTEGDQFCHLHQCGSVAQQILSKDP